MENGLFVFSAREDYVSIFLSRLKASPGVSHVRQTFMTESGGQVRIPFVNQLPVPHPFVYVRSGEEAARYEKPILQSSVDVRPFHVSGRILQVEFVPVITFLEDSPRSEIFPELKTMLVVEPGQPVVFVQAENKPGSLGEALLGQGTGEGRKILLAVFTFELPS
jgi:hypothetical protein